MDEVADQLAVKRRGRKPGLAKAAATPSFAVAPPVTTTAMAAVQAAEAIDAAIDVARPAPVEPTPPAEAVAAPADHIAPTPAEILAPQQEGTPEMATVAPNMTDTAAMTTDKLQSLFGDMGSRFKASFEKSSKLGEEMVELTKGNVEAVVASARVAAKGGEALGQDAAEYTKKSFESAVAAMKSFASVKSPTELFTLQSEFAKASFDSAVAEASRFSESMMKLAGDVAQPLSTRYAVAAEKIKSAAL